MVKFTAADFEASAASSSHNIDTAGQKERRRPAPLVLPIRNRVVISQGRLRLPVAPPSPPIMGYNTDINTDTFPELSLDGFTDQVDDSGISNDGGSDKIHCMLHCKDRVCSHARGYRNLRDVLAEYECKCLLAAPPSPIFAGINEYVNIEAFPNFVALTGSAEADADDDHCTLHCEHGTCAGLREMECWEEVFDKMQCKCPHPSDTAVTKAKAPEPASKATIYEVIIQKPDITDFFTPITVYHSDTTTFLTHIETHPTFGPIPVVYEALQKYFRVSMTEEGTVGKGIKKRSVTPAELVNEIELQLLYAFLEMLEKHDPRGVSHAEGRGLVGINIAREAKASQKLSPLWNRWTKVAVVMLELLKWRDGELTKVEE